MEAWTILAGGALAYLAQWLGAGFGLYWLGLDDAHPETKKFWVDGGLWLGTLNGVRSLFADLKAAPPTLTESR